MVYCKIKMFRGNNVTFGIPIFKFILLYFVKNNLHTSQQFYFNLVPLFINNWQKCAPDPVLSPKNQVIIELTRGDI